MNSKPDLHSATQSGAPWPQAAAVAPRLAVLAALGKRLLQAKAELVAAAGADTGTPCRVAALEVELAADHLLTMAAEVPLVAGKQPYGLVAAIFPYDAVPVMLARLGGGAVLGGNRCRISFSSWTPRQAQILADLLTEADWWQPVVGQDNRSFGAACVADPAVRVLFISGSGELGRQYAAQAAAFDKLFFAGPSGMPAAILGEDTPIEPAVRYLLRRAFINGGQYCTTLKKAYIAAPVYEEVKAALLALLPEIKAGPPEDPEAWLGPLKVTRTRLLLKKALGQLRQPRFLTSFDLEAEIVHPIICEVADVPDLELFGPFLALIRVRDSHEGVLRAVRTRYPFAVSVFGTITPALEQQLRQTFGMVYLNPDFTFTPLRLPFGGRRDSGWILERHQGGWRRRDGAFLYSAELVRDAAAS